MSSTTLAMIILFVALLAVTYATTPTCAPGEVYARGAITLVCVKGHN